MRAPDHLVVTERRRCAGRAGIQHEATQGFCVLEPTMKTPTRLVRIFLLAGGIGVGLLAAGPASAQYQCPYGYYYYPAWGCVAGSPYGPYGYYPGFDGFFFFDG